jgi:hypothetical protein
MAPTLTTLPGASGVCYAYRPDGELSNISRYRFDTEPGYVLITPFLTNTKPVGFLGTEEIDAIKSLSISTLDALQSDIESNIFINYRKSENIERVYGIELLSIEDTIDFLLYHEGFHTGYIAGLKRLL